MEFFTTGSGYTNKNKFIIVKEIQYYYRFQFSIVILPVLVLLFFNKLLV